MKALKTIVIYVMLSNSTTAQPSYRIQLDTVKYLWLNPIIELAADGDVIFGFADDQLKIMKLDFAGNIVWSNNYGYNSFGNTYEQMQISASPDSGFYLSTPVEEDMFSWFQTAYIRKFDKFGSQQYFVKSDNVTAPIEGEEIRFIGVNKYSYDIYTQGTHSEYDGNLDVICCYHFHDLSFNSSLNLILKTQTNTAGLYPITVTYDSVGTTNLIGYKNNQFGSNYYTIGCMDSLKNYLWERKFYFDTTQISYIRVMDIKCTNNEKYSLLVGNYNQRNRVILHKLNDQWETIYFKVLDPYNPLLSSEVIYNMQMGVSTNSNVIISGFRQLSQYSKYSMLMELDSNGNELYSWRSTDDFYYNSTIVDSTTGSALLLRRTNGSGAKFIQLERQFPSNPSCNYVPYQLNPIDFVVNDSLFIMNNSAFPSPLPSFSSATITLPVTYNPVMTPICGVYSSVFYIDSIKSCSQVILSIENNEELNLNSECALMRNTFLSIYDICGKLIFQQESNKIKFPYKIPLFHIKPGLYIVKTLLEQGIPQNIKFIVH